jgi:hypothetical protein
MKIISGALLLLGGTVFLNAMEFQSMGYKATSMGGAGVSSATGAMAAYYNPALLAHAKHDVDVSLGVGVQYRDNGLGAKASKLADQGFFNAIDAIGANSPNNGSNSADNIKALVNGRDTIMTMNDETLQLQPNAHLGFQVSNFGFGVYVSTEAAAVGNVDQTRDRFIFENQGLYYNYNPSTDQYAQTTKSDYVTNSIDYAFKNGKTNILTFGVVIAELPLAYAYDFKIPSGHLSVGGAAKVMIGRSYFKTQRIDKKNDNSNSAKNLDKSSTNFGLDIGVHYQSTYIKGLSAGVVLKNINRPSFDTAMEGKKVNVDPLMRLGVSYMILDSLEAAFDLDLTENKLIDDTTKSRMFGGGLSWQPVSWLNISGGLMRDLSIANEGMIYTAGFGLGLQVFHLDIAAQISGKNNSYQGTSVPRYGNVMFAFNSSW